MKIKILFTDVFLLYILENFKQDCLYQGEALNFPIAFWG